MVYHVVTLGVGVSRDKAILVVLCAAMLMTGIGLFSYFLLTYDTSPDPLYYDYVPNEETKNIG